MKLRTVAAAVIASLLAVSISLPAAQADTQAELQSRYGSLTGALLSAHATNSGKSLSTFLQERNTTLYVPRDDSSSLRLAPQLAQGNLDLPQLEGFDSISLTASTLPELNEQLLSHRVGLDTSSMSSLADLTQSVLSSPNSLDAAVTVKGAQWANEFALTALQAPETPNLPGRARVPAGALPFGLLLNKSLTAMAADAPELIADVGRTGAGSTRVESAWKQAMSNAWTQSRTDLERTVGDPCTGGMLAVMATGNRSAARDYGSCSTACVASGVYLHRQATYLFSPASLSKSTNPVSGVYNPAATYGLPLAVQSQLAQTPELGNADVTQMLAGAGTGCSAASSAVTSGLKGVLPGVWGNLTAP